MAQLVGRYTWDPKLDEVPPIEKQEGPYEIPEWFHSEHPFVTDHILNRGPVDGSGYYIDGTNIRDYDQCESCYHIYHLQLTHICPPLQPNELIPQPKKEVEKEVDMVNSPPHYRSKNGLEVIDVIEGFGFDDNMRLSHVLRYILRCRGKDSYLQCLEKAEYYLKREIKRCKEDSDYKYYSPSKKEDD